MAAKMDMSKALDIANDRVVYAENEAVSKWIDRKELCAILSGNETIMQTEPVLASFYEAQSQTHLKELVQVDELLTSLHDSVKNENDSTFYDMTLQNAIDANEHIESENPLVMNEKSMNQFYLKWLTVGLDDLNDEEKINIETMARSCPYVNGTAVYKARTLYASVGGGVGESDWQICQNTGTYKTKAQETIDLDGVSMADENNMSISPNPFHDHLLVDYRLTSQEEGVLELYNILGQQKFKTAFSHSNNRVNISTLHLPSGMYAYRYLINGQTMQKGKLLKE
jgi:hypothetical protein